MLHNNKNVNLITHNPQQGYTIVEVLIFLAISSIMAVSALIGLSGQQRRTEFAQASREAESVINDVMNDFITGWAPTAGSQFAPTGSGDCTSIPTAFDQGTSIGCTYIGKVIQFGVDGNPEDIRVYSVIGRQFKAGGGITPVENIIEARPIPLTTNIRETRFGYGVAAQELTVNRGGGVVEPVGAIGFFSSFAELNPTGIGDEVSSGRQSTTVIAIPGTALGQSEADVMGAIRGIVNYAGGNYLQLRNDYVNRPVRLCLLENGQRAFIDIGDNQQRAATKVTIDSASTCT